MARTAQDVLEFDKLLELLRQRTTCAPGRRFVDGLRPGMDRTAITVSFALIREAREWLRATRELGFGALADPQNWLGRIEGPGMVLEAREFLDAATLLETAGWLRQQFREEETKFPLLAARAAALSEFKDMLAVIRRSVLPTGEISDDASPALRKIRASIAQTRRSVPGVVHGASATGQTIFMEPLETVETNNQLVQLREDEAAEIVRILRELTERLQRVREPLVLASETIAELDSVFARARFAQEFDAAIPEFSEASELRLEAARHPVLENKLRKEGRAVVPMTLALGGEERVLVISGPNTGGKTVALKTTGIAALSAQSGIPVAAQRAVLPFFDRVLVDIGDEQSIAADLSTFSAHMLNLKAMLEAATAESLVLVDEMGTGTAPEEGAALAVALLDEFRAKNCIVLATTHHDRLKTYASTTPGVVNAAVEFDDVNLRPTYRLMVGVPGGSSEIAIARRLGIAEPIIARARALMAPEALEAADLIAYLHRSRDELDRMQHQMTAERHALEEERKKLRDEWVGRQQSRIRELEEKFAEMQKRFDENVARVVESVKERELRGSLDKFARRKAQDVRGEARDELNAAVVQTISESQQDLGAPATGKETLTQAKLQPITRIHVRGFSKPVVLRRIDGTSAEIEAGPLRMKVGLDEITGVESPIAAGSVRPPKGSVTLRAQASDEGTGGEINLIGCTVEEATERVDKFLDEAALANRSRVRIIHGHGTGALRKGLAQFLSKHPLVDSQSFEPEERGGKAITIVDLRA